MSEGSGLLARLSDELAGAVEAAGRSVVRVNARGRQLDGFVRTDAVLLPGFSGGALVDVAGRAVGLTTSHFGQGTGFAIRVGTVQRVVEQLLQGGRVKRGYLGVSSQPVPLPAGLKEKYKLDQETALLLVGVEPSGPAERGGLLMGDLLVGLGGDPIKDTDDLQWALRSERVGQSVKARVVR